MVQIITNLRTKDQVHFFRGRMNCKTQWLSEVDPQLSQLLQTLSRIKIEQGPESKSLYVFELSSFEEKTRIKGFLQTLQSKHVRWTSRDAHSYQVPTKVLEFLVELYEKEEYQKSILKIVVCRFAHHHFVDESWIDGLLSTYVFFK